MMELMCLNFIDLGQCVVITKIKKPTSPGYLNSGTLSNWDSYQSEEQGRYSFNCSNCAIHKQNACYAMRMSVADLHARLNVNMMSCLVTLPGNLYYIPRGTLRFVELRADVLFAYSFSCPDQLRASFL